MSQTVMIYSLTEETEDLHLKQGVLTDPERYKSFSSQKPEETDLLDVYFGVKVGSTAVKVHYLEILKMDGNVIYVPNSVWGLDLG